MGADWPESYFMMPYDLSIANNNLRMTLDDKLIENTARSAICISS